MCAAVCNVRCGSCLSLWRYVLCACVFVSGLLYVCVVLVICCVMMFCLVVYMFLFCSVCV